MSDNNNPASEPSEAPVPSQPQVSSGESSTGVGESNAYPTKAEFESLAEKQKSGQNLLLAIMAGVVIFIAITFIVEIVTMNLDRIKDKDLYLKYNDLYDQYVEKNSELEKKIMNLQIEINNFRNEIDLLKAKNSYLK